MKATILFLFSLLSAVAVTAQTPQELQYSSRAIALMSNDGSEAILPIFLRANGKTDLVFIPGSKLDETMKSGGTLVTLGDIEAAYREATDAVSRLQTANQHLRAENEKLWKVATKTPALAQPTPQPSTTVVVEPSPAPQTDSLSLYLLLRSFLPQTPQTNNLNVHVSDCTRLPALCAGQ